MKTSTFLTFVGDQCGKATEAINLYTDIFPNSEIIRITHYKKGEPGGSPDLIKYGVFTINGTEYMVSESSYNHAWNFSHANSILIRDESPERIQKLFDQLSKDGQVMVPLDNYNGEGDYGFGKKFGWCQDKFGISWQFILTDE
ncbi:VOC family protein [Luteibaculum oceani]|uniref:VOC family protein n=1 Tax=Luteibaculum oceani TaxID=1294296 RepID=A0A5C6V4G3_9FLAO|nr:VOC family protein [Luteibaculum oceani]TXC78345.1 VOC family protein [Luteibaculum oceani]